ncbi:hypothetical protein LDO26_15575 [Luteimonas sp. BDR2-5]|uniref:hypothetical protein n=1 Tax=Proluteimonas luteida TaxID=2878685 RepID=UPI001E501301|nr:hypothetical protein [Luteimonas sp. BDR2-5]MCD9029613.1 hypothetical protein [Luteimonas sp. BDR2-5]
MTRDDGYWFPAKSFGWGWGPPRRWQGWLTLAVYVLALVALSIAVPPTARPALFTGGVLLATALLVLVCLLKGEPPHWRWRR